MIFVSEGERRERRCTGQQDLESQTLFGIRFRWLTHDFQKRIEIQLAITPLILLPICSTGLSYKVTGYKRASLGPTPAKMEAASSGTDNLTRAHQRRRF